MPILEKETSLFPGNLLADFTLEATSEDHAASDALASESVLYGRCWWVAHTRPRQEKSLARALLTAEIPFYLPLVAKNLVVRGTRRTSYVPVFGSYVFLFARDEDRLAALKTDRVAHLLPVADGDELRRDLQNIQLLIELDAPLTVERRIQPGAAVRIRRGPLEGVEGIVESRKGQTRLVVLVHMLQQGVSLEIDDALIEPL
jgi:transcriptional antiterminator RfaH